jgi:hypothetical protein
VQNKLQKNQRRKLVRKEAILRAKKERRVEERRRRAEKRRSGQLERRVPISEFEGKLEAAVKAGVPRVCVDFRFGSEMTGKVS